MYGITPPENAFLVYQTTPWFASKDFVGINSENCVCVDFKKVVDHAEKHGTDFDIYFFINYVVYDLYGAYKIPFRKFMLLQKGGAVKPYKMQTNGKKLVLCIDKRYTTLVKHVTRKEYINSGKDRLKNVQNT